MRVARFAVLLLALISVGEAQTPGAKNRFIGADVCKGCHAPLFETFFRNPHFKTQVTADEPANQTCEGCHGPGLLHIQKGGDPASIVSFRNAPPRIVLDACLRCHSEDLGKADIRRSPHTRQRVVCTGCHSIHQARELPHLLAKPQTQLCYGCHSAVAAEFSLPVKHRVNEGLIQCTDCHNPHGTELPSWRMGLRSRMVRQAAGAEQPCLRCHPDLRGPFVFEHAAVRVDGCEVCHAPHGSTNARLLRRPMVFPLCLECHTGGGAFGRQADGIPTQSSAHNMADPRYRQCTTCHVRIHGSNSDPRFLR